jgi:hypothetical protein
MRMSKERFARYKNGKPHFAVCEVGIDFSPEVSTVVVDCNGRGFYSQGYIESVPAKGYEHWKQGAKIGIEFALLTAQAVNCHVTITRIEGLTTDTNPTIVGFAAILAVWQALEFNPSREMIEKLENQVFESWNKPYDELPMFF